MKLRLVLAATACLSATAALAEVRLSAIYLRQQIDAPPTLSNLDPVPEDLGVDGAKLGLADNQTTGRFLGQDFNLDVVSVAPGGDFLGEARAALGQTDILLVDAPAEPLLELADLPEAEGALLFNVSSEEMRLRDADCRSNVLHTAASLAMRTDALAQFLVSRRWTRTAQITGPHASDELFSAALDASLVKFGLEPGPPLAWAFDADMRRNASEELPTFTQELDEYDVLLVSDEIGDWGRYVLHNTWRPRPVAGSVGLEAASWTPVLEQWGAAQFQGRFEEAAGRDMEPRDYAAWAAIRTLGEAVTRTGASEVGPIRDYILSDAFEIAGFKGQSLSFRRWNGQMRQPIPLFNAEALVALAPLDGFLHQKNELDSLGLDEAEGSCRDFQEHPQ
jgi:ABC transporter substrate binding protein (PQQ-dependent alcohol dehydrogenase system)